MEEKILRAIVDNSIETKEGLFLSDVGIDVAIDEILSNIKIQLAEAQLYGWSSGKHGESLIAIVNSMGLDKTEWEELRENYPSTLNRDEINEIDGYFRSIHYNK